MRKSSKLCCDANIVVRMVTGADGGIATDLWRRWREERRTIVAPYLLRYEVSNALHRLRIAGQLTDSAVEEFLRAALALPITYDSDETLHVAAVRLATRFNRPAAYDAHYLALAERENAEFWTADQRLYNAVRHHLPWVHLVDS